MAVRLRFASDKAKPSLATFANPFFIDQRPGSRSARLWGQVRPGVTHGVTVERRRAGTKRWTKVRTLTTNGAGYWKLTQTVNATTDYRFTWQPTDAYDAPVGTVKHSDVLRAKRRQEAGQARVKRRPSTGESSSSSRAASASSAARRSGVIAVSSSFSASHAAASAACASSRTTFLPRS